MGELDTFYSNAWGLCMFGREEDAYEGLYDPYPAPMRAVTDC